MRDTGTPTAVVSNGAGRLAMWPLDRPVPPGWVDTGVHGSREGCAAELDRLGSIEPAPAEPGPSLVTLVDDTVRRQPDGAAVDDGRRSLSYRALNRESDAVAGWLRERGIGRGDRVAVYRARGVSAISTLLGTLKAGAAYVAIDTRYPDARRDSMIRLSRARLVVTGPGWNERLAHLPVAVAELANETLPDGAGTAGGPDPLGPEDTACVLFTSGSSGTPKAIVLTHGNLCYFAANAALPRFTPQDRTAQVSSMSFDGFHFEVWGSLAAGAEVVVLPTMAELVANDLERELQRARITAMVAPTMAVNHVVYEDRDAFAPLRILHTGGDVLQPAAAREILAGAFRGEFYNLYGPAEAATACTMFRVNDLTPDADTVPIGAPLAGAAVQVLDADLNPARIGDVGEIHIGGPGVARGYLDQSALTAERFLPDPYGEPGSAMYATGDLGRRRPDGLLEFVGRADDQVKIRGYRVEPREVERILGRHPAVCEAAVLVMGDDQDRRLVALIVAQERIAPRALRAFAESEMPDYMVPAAFVTVREIPGTEHGKRDLPALTELARQHLRRHADRVPPSDDTEAYLVTLWEELLAVENVGVTDDFFALGGNSLLAFRAKRRIKRDLGVDIEVRELLEPAELGELAARLREMEAEVDHATVPVNR